MKVRTQIFIRTDSPDTYDKELEFSDDGCVVEVDFVQINDSKFNIGDRYCNYGTIIDIFIHPESDSSWLICKTDDNGMFTIAFDYYNIAGYTDKTYSDYYEIRGAKHDS